MAQTAYNSIKHKKLSKYSGSSEQNQDLGCLRTGDFNIHETKYFQDAVFHQKL